MFNKCIIFVKHVFYKFPLHKRVEVGGQFLVKNVCQHLQGCDDMAERVILT